MSIIVTAPAAATAATAIAEHVSAAGGFERLTHPRRVVDYSREGLKTLLVKEGRLAEYTPATERAVICQMTSAEQAEVVAALAAMLCERP